MDLGKIKNIIYAASCAQEKKGVHLFLSIYIVFFYRYN